jgi:hypothetical protein
LNLVGNGDVFIFRKVITRQEDALTQKKKSKKYEEVKDNDEVMSDER